MEYLENVYARNIVSKPFKTSQNISAMFDIYIYPETSVIGLLIVYNFYVVYN